ncbi:N-6 DNA methylase [Methanosarcina sp. WH1]|uniref:N-6 DNA methylase n=1 Tax=Methanosarcina sp. WH1 TaxID=1434102 RepID=UPI000615B6A4|nr:N-6 DNA methylase [Methanosarcina sp. WH1]AKB21905.1 Type I restriction-modification system, DNA-methyltransferase subunit M [Methanosarcina sp. WH1]
MFISTFIPTKELSGKFRTAHDMMRNIDGLQPQEAFDELLKYIFLKTQSEIKGDILDCEKRLCDSGSFLILENEQYTKLNKLLYNYLERVEWLETIWNNKKFNLSKKALIAIHEIFKDVTLTDISVDKKSAALRTFLTPDIRKGLGIFLTPDEVVKSIVEYIDPKPGEKILDLACGSATFLIESCKRLQNNSPNISNFELYGLDKNPRMLLLAQLNLGFDEKCIFHNKLADSLFVKEGSIDWYVANSFDIIITNPPFGVILDSDQYDLSKYSVCLNKKRQYSELVFLEKCMKLLKPGGRLGIVLPRSVVTNSSFFNERRELSKYGYIESIVVLPAETFQISGTQTTTILLFAKKYSYPEEMEEKSFVKYVNILNIGYDSTGRFRDGNELPYLASNLKDNCESCEKKLKLIQLGPTKKSSTLSNIRELMLKRFESEDCMKLGELTTYVGTGRTPPRSKYSKNDEGLFLVKVGNLTGKGIDWLPRDRNFIGEDEKKKRENSSTNLMLQKNDILLTSSAHSPKYIAEKVDFIEEIPGVIGGQASYVGEVMLIRPDIKKIDPYLLYIYLSLPSTKEKIQSMITGQTAHLNSNDLKSLTVPMDYIESTHELNKFKEIVKQQVKLAAELNCTIFKKLKLINLVESSNIGRDL